MTKTINPENWVDDKITYSLDEDNNLFLLDEMFHVEVSKMENGTMMYRIEEVGITSFKVDSEYYASDDCDSCGRDAEDPIDAIVKVIANIY